MVLQFPCCITRGPSHDGKRFKVNLHSSLDSTCKSTISKFCSRCKFCVCVCVCFCVLVRYIQQLFIPKLRIEIFTLISFMGFTAIYKHITVISNVHIQLGGTFNGMDPFTRFGTYWDNMHKYRLVLVALLPRILRCIKCKTVPTCFTAKKYPKLLPKLIAVHTHQRWKQKWDKWDVTIVIPTMHCKVTPDVTFCVCGGYIQQTHTWSLKFTNRGVHSTTFDPNLRNESNHFSKMGGTFNNFWSWTHTWS